MSESTIQVIYPFLDLGFSPVKYQTKFVTVSLTHESPSVIELRLSFLGFEFPRQNSSFIVLNSCALVLYLCQ